MNLYERTGIFKHSKKLLQQFSNSETISTRWYKLNRKYDVRSCLSQSEDTNS